MHLKDIGYFKLDRMDEQTYRGEYYVSLSPHGTRVFRDSGDKEALDVHDWLKRCRQQGARYAE